MKKNEIKVGSLYTAKVSSKLVTVKVTDIRENCGMKGNQTHYFVTNLSTGRKTVFRSAAKFRTSVKAAKQPSDPTSVDCEDTPTLTKSSDGSSIHSTSMSPSTLMNSMAPSTSGLASKMPKTVEDTAPHVIVEARAGTGKTTTLIEGLKRVKGIESSLVPSPQQAAVWEAMELSKGKARTICFVAFNKSIATELQQRVPAGCDAMTMHSMGYKAVQQALGRCEPTSWVVQDLIAEILQTDLRVLRRDKPVVLKAAEQLVSLCKMNLVGINAPEGSYDGWDYQLAELATAYDIDLNGQSREVFSLVPQVLDRCKDPSRQGNKITFDDMIWLPIVLNLPITQYDLLLVDEAQDLNRCQQALAKRAGKRLILCGDPKQAIYGFAGADAQSMARLEQELSGRQTADCPKCQVPMSRYTSEGIATKCVNCGTDLVQPDRGCLHLPLTVTRRCGKAIVREAQKYVPDFSAFETNPEGKITAQRVSPTEHPDCYRLGVQDGDMVLSRVNAPLVSECFKFLRAGRKANIQGRDVGAGLISTVKKCLKVKDDAELSGYSVSTLVSAVSEWLYAEERKENAKRNPSEARLIAFRDRHDCIVCFTEGATTAQDVVNKINIIFTDDKNGTGINLSSIHKAKGLEAKRVFLLRTKDAPCPHPMAKTPSAREQETNLLYVAITRAIEELAYVTD